MALCMLEKYLTVNAGSVRLTVVLIRCPVLPEGFVPDIGGQ